MGRIARSIVVPISIRRLLLVATAALLSLSQSCADARPIKSSSQAQAVKTLSIIQPEMTIDHISKYTTEYFLETVRYKQLECNSCLFYTFYLTAAAQRYARGAGNGLVTIWDMWPSDFYNGEVGDVKNPLRGIFNNTVTTRTYYENMSSAMAQLCGGFVTVMTKDPKNIPLDGIWGRSELPTLKRNGNQGGQVHTVIAIDPKGDNSKTSWVHPRPDSKTCETGSSSMKTQSLAKRQGVTHYSPDQLQDWFAAVPF